MNSSSTTSAFATAPSQPSLQAAHVYSDINGLQSIKQLAKNDKNEALGEVSRQFESILLQSMLKSMRAANQVFSEGNYLSSEQVQFYQDMFDDQLSLELTRGDGIGLAEQIRGQLQYKYGDRQRADQSDSSVSDNFSDRVRIIQAVRAEQSNSPSSVSSADARAGITSFDGSPEQFISNLYPQAEQAAASLNLPVDVLLAQSALETGWGQFVPRGENGQSSFNLFGIKADARWDGPSVTVQTLEYHDGQAVRVNASFRRYDSYAESFADYASFIQQQPRYQTALEAASGAGHYLGELQRAGYATDPNYAEKIDNIILRPEFRAAIDQRAQAGNALSVGG